ncbi:MAG: hypothetical protein LHV69_07130, partial [Elusimicrobia bacterium]|nr:hypothetical protein [Candidatus Obscuribacterium magneticum]
RYAEFGMMLIPLSLVSWTLILNGFPKLRTGFLAATWLLLAAAYGNNWAYFERYQWMSERRNAGWRCVTAYYLQQGDGHCPMIYLDPLKGKLEEARNLRLSFYREIEEGMEGLEPAGDVASRP